MLIRIRVRLQSTAISNRRRKHHQRQYHYSSIEWVLAHLLVSSHLLLHEPIRRRSRSRCPRTDHRRRTTLPPSSPIHDLSCWSECMGTIGQSNGDHSRRCAGWRSCLLLAWITTTTTACRGTIGNETRWLTTRARELNVRHWRVRVRVRS